MTEPNNENRVQLPSEIVDQDEEYDFEPHYQQKKINVFVSSTFRDMKAERDELTLQVFPALRKVCEERGIAWGEVDLRWGIPPEKEKEEVLDICLTFIEQCRPYFIAMLGERYGYIEETLPEEIFKDYPWIKDHKGKSITELEILHGVLNNPAMAGHAFFYFRDPEYIKTLPVEQQSEFLEGLNHEDIIKYGVNEAERRAEKRRSHLAALKESIRRSGVPIKEGYPDPIRFGELVKKDLMQVIDSLAQPLSQLTDAEYTGSTLDRENMAHEVFAASRFGVYIPRQEYFHRLDKYVSGDGLPLAVLGESGSGKSALLAHWVFRYRNHHPDNFVLIHFAGASSDSTDWALMLRRFMGELKRKFPINAEIPANSKALPIVFASWLSIAAEQCRVVLVIDALDQLENKDGASDLVWLPLTLPDNIRLIVSTLPGRSLDALVTRGWSTMNVEPLTVLERNSLITKYLYKYRRKLEDPIREELAKAEQTKNPLFLRALLEEIRLHGEYGKLHEQIRNYLTVDTVEGLYDMILAGYERDYERDRNSLVKDAVSLIWAARRGLSKSELMDLLGSEGKPLPAAYWAPLFLAMEKSCIEKSGLINFFHQYFMKAIEKRYLPNDDYKRIYHVKLAEYFSKQDIKGRRVEEEPWQWAKSQMWEQLLSLLDNSDFLTFAYKMNKFDIAEYWAKIESNSEYRMEDIYKPVINQLDHYSNDYIWAINDILSILGYDDSVFNLNKSFIDSSIKSKDVSELWKAYFNIARIFHWRGDFDQAIKYSLEQEKICIQIKNIEGQVWAVYSLFCSYSEFSHNVLGFWKSVLYSSEPIQRLITELNKYEILDPDDVNKLREIYTKYPPSLIPLIKISKLLDLSERLLAEQISVNGTHLKNIELFDDAMLAYKEAEQLSRQNGDLYLLGECLHNEGSIIKNKGLLDDALNLYKEEEQTSLQIGNPEGYVYSLYGQSDVLSTISYDKRDLRESYRLYKKSYNLAKQYHYKILRYAFKRDRRTFVLRSLLRKRYLATYTIEFVCFTFLKMPISIIFIIIALTVLIISYYSVHNWPTKDQFYRMVTCWLFQ